MSGDEFQGSGSGIGRKVFLVLLLLAVGGMFGYDYLVSQPAFREGVAKLESIQDPSRDENGDAELTEGGAVLKVGDVNKDGRISPDDVHKYMTMEPAAVDTQGDTIVLETFCWQRGVPLLSYSAYVAYSRIKDADGNETLTLFRVYSEKPEKVGTEYEETPPDERPPGLAMGGAPGGQGGKKDDSSPGKGNGKEDTGAGSKSDGGSSSGDKEPEGSDGSDNTGNGSDSR